MTLYKYIRPERIDVVENLEIRFTQPNALNDPFELQPQFDSLIAEAELLANMPERPSDLRPMVAQAYEMLPELSVLPLDLAMEAIEEFMATEEARQATAEGLRIFLQSMRDGAATVREAIYKALNDNVGILSLSEVPDNELMWAHYADSHKGLVLCFDETHPFFDRRRSESDAFYFIRKVQYFDDSPVSLTTIDIDAVLVLKGTSWSYEREWRMLVPLNDPTHTVPVEGDIIYLYQFPSEALVGIILGAHATQNTETLVRNLLRDRADLRHIRWTRAVLNLETRSVAIPPLDVWSGD
jgi:hypothetical protein